MNTTSLEYALGRLMDIGGNGEIRLEILRFSRQKSQKTGSEDFALAFRISREGETPESTMAGTDTGKEAETEAGTAAGAAAGAAAGTPAGTGTGKEPGTAAAGTAGTAGTPASSAPAAPDRTEIMEA